MTMRSLPTASLLLTGLYGTLCFCLIALPSAGQTDSTLASMDSVDDWNGQWIGVIGGNKPNTWICYRKTIDLDQTPQQAIARIACDSKYWLWINDKPVVFEGQLKRGPTPRDTYFDKVDLTPHLNTGQNTIAILVWYFGTHGFSHNSSGKAALLFDATIDGQILISDESWRVRVHPAFGTTDPPKDNVRQPEANIRFDARHDIANWHSKDYDDSSWGPPTLFGKPPTPPWNQLFIRPIPQWKNSGVVDYEKVDVRTKDNLVERVCTLPYNCHVTPYLKVKAPAGRVIDIHSDIYDMYGQLKLVETHRHEYVTCEGVQEFELPCWINGHEIRYVMPQDVEVLKLRYRETGFDTEFLGNFECDDAKLNQLWEESLRTLYVTMRDTYMDCPDRERAQWWGDAVNEIGEAFYALDTEKAPMLAKKGIYELVRWQRPDGVLYSPVPSGVRVPELDFPMDGSWKKELPQQMLASVGWYGFWNYYRYSGDRDTIAAVYPYVKKYLSLWQFGDDGLVVHRPGGWDWTDWGNNIDVPPTENAWYYLALKAAIEMANLSGNQQDVAAYQLKLKSIEDHYRPTFWTGKGYRSPSYDGPTDDRANAMAVVSGLALPQDYAEICNVLTSQQHASPYMEKYVLEALMLMHKPKLARQRMKSRYAAMLEDSCSTLWEMFDEMVLEGFGSLGRGTCNHAWSGGPLTILSQYFAGIAPVSPAFETYEVLPQLGELTHVEATVPTRYGFIDLEIKRTGEVPLQMELSSPEGTIATVGLPEAHLPLGATVRVNDTVIARGETRVENDLPITQVGRDENYVLFKVPAGDWDFVVENDGTDTINVLTDKERTAGFKLLFNGSDLTDWNHEGNWVVQNGAIYRASDGGFLVYAPHTLPDDFELRFQWRIAQGGNSGLYYRPTQYEYQILDNKIHSDGKNPRTSAASLYFCMAPSHDATNPAGQWNTARIVCKGTVIQHWLNGKKVVGFDYADPQWAAYVDLLRERKGDLSSRNGHLSIQDHGDPVWYRGIKLRTLGPDDELNRTPVIPAEVPKEALEHEQEILAYIRSLDKQRSEGGNSP